MRFGRLDDLRPGAPNDPQVEMLVLSLTGGQVGTHADEDAAPLVGFLGGAQVGGDRVVVRR